MEGYLTMAKHTKEALLERLQQAMNDLYHNATPAYFRNVPDSLQEECWQWFQDTAQFELENCDHPIIKMFGRLYTWGRGGRTLAPEKLIRQGGGGSFSIGKAEDYNESSNAWLTEACQCIESFNAYVTAWNSKENLTFLWNDHCECNRSSDAIEAKKLRKEMKVLAREAKSTLLPDNVCNVVREKLARVKEARKELIARCAAYTEALTAN
jgi:hypothetical protein